MNADIQQQIDWPDWLRRWDAAGLCETSPSWRLLVVRPCGLELSHHSFYTSSEEPLISIFNSYWDIPIGRVGDAWRVD